MKKFGGSMNKQPARLLQQAQQKRLQEKERSGIREKISQLKQAVLNSADLKQKIEKQLASRDMSAGKATVFFSVCNGQERAMVLHRSAGTLEQAFESAASVTENWVLQKHYNPLWLRVDVISESHETSLNRTAELIKPMLTELFRYGIALDPDLNAAYLEEELNGNKLIDYETGRFKVAAANKYGKTQGRDPVSEPQQSVYLFNTFAWIVDEEGLHELHTDFNSHGRRLLPKVDADYAFQLVKTGAQFLYSQLKEDGAFVYGIYPVYDKIIENYNILRHISTLWSMVVQYRLSQDQTVLPHVRRAFDYAFKNYVDDFDSETSFLVERKANEIKLGGNAVAILALTDYMDATGSDEYRALCVRFGNGILKMFDAGTGKFVHVLNAKTYQVSAAYRTVYYDGEATFALTRLYSLTGDAKWLEAAERSVKHFIEADYTVHRDHWVAYALNEITQYLPKEEYFSFALKNADVNLNEIYYRVTTYHTYFELLMSTFETYDRIVKNGYQVNYLAKFNKEFFFRSIDRRADYMLNGFTYPEFIMYFKVPSHIRGAFFVRHDGYRVRIDDVQHNIGGYYKYYKNYDLLCEYKQKLGIE